MNSYQWLLFDADNTLFDFDSAEEHTLTRTLLHFGQDAEKKVKQLYHRINDELWKRHEMGELSREQLSVRRFEILFQALNIQGDPVAWNDYYLQTLSQCATLLPGAESLCRRAAQKYTLALITNGAPFVQRRRLELSPLGQFFGDRVFISGEMGCRKPEKAYFEAVLSALGVAGPQRKKVLVIGDSLSSDIKGAFQSRLDSVWLRNPGASSGVMKPTFEVESLPQLAQLLGVDRYVNIPL